MKKLPSENPSYVLEASLQMLHEESRSWISELDFWKDETKFFLNLLRKKHVKSIMEGKSEIYNEVLAKLTVLNDPKISDLKSEINKHERSLAKLLQESNSANDQAYRQNHRNISEKISRMDDEFRQIKKNLFIIVEDWP